MGASWTDFLRQGFADIQSALGYTPNVTSGLRTPAYNAQVGGVPNSYHIQGRSLDLTPPSGVSMTQLYNDLAGTGINFTELLNEGNHVHVTLPATLPGNTSAVSTNAAPSSIGDYVGLIGTAIGAGLGTDKNTGGGSTKSSSVAGPLEGFQNWLAQISGSVLFVILGLVLLAGALYMLAVEAGAAPSPAEIAKGVATAAVVA